MASPNQMFGSSRPRPAFLSSMGSGTPTGLTPPSQNRPENDRQRRKERLEQQQKEIDDFKSNLKVVENTGGTLYQEEAPMFNPNTGRYERTTLAQIQIDLANQYGPTFREIVQDMGGGISSAFQGLAEKGTPLIALMRGLYDKGKDFVTQGIPNVLKGESQFDTPVYQSSPSLFEGRPTETFVPPTFTNDKIKREGLESISSFPYNFETIMKTRPEPLGPEEMSQEQFKQSYPFLYAENVGLPSLQDLYNLSQNPEINTNMGNFRLDNVFTGDPRLGYSNTVMINGVPVNLNANIGQGGNLGLGASLTFKDGGTVDKYSGLGYKLR